LHGKVVVRVKVCDDVGWVGEKGMMLMRMADMEIDGQSTTSKKSSNSASRAKRAGGRIQKKRRGKAQSTIVFPKFDLKKRSLRSAKRGAQK
jgi:hypothetical protein